MWSDNESAIDLLGFQHLSDLITKIVRNLKLLPATVGVFGDWGSGKSSLLEMVKVELARDPKTLVVSFNGWQFEGFEDAKEALIGTILDELKDNQVLSAKAKEFAKLLLQRLDILRIAGTIGKYGLAFALAGPAGLGIAASADSAGAVMNQVGKSVGEYDLGEAQKFVKPAGEDVRKSVREFRKDFCSLLASTEGVRLVVVIDDLDRCLPETIIETLEAIKLFLFVPNTAFVIGADERLVKYAVRKRFPELPGENTEVGRDYLEKLVQFAVRIPPLNRAEIETYINLLFAQLPGLLPGEFEKARSHVVNCDPATLLSVRFNYGVAQSLFQNVPVELQDQLALAQRLAPVLSTGLRGNPRQCKRFLNTLMMRLQMSASRKVELQQRMLAKLMLLEYFKPEWFRRLADLQAAEDGKPAALLQLEQLARGGDPHTKPEAKKATTAKRQKDSMAHSESDSRDQAASSAPAKPIISQDMLAWETDPWMRDWLVMEPFLAKTDLRPYFYFARDQLDSLGGAVRRLTPRAQELLNQLLQDSEAIRELALTEAKDLSPADAAAVFEAMAVRMSHEEDLTAEDSLFERIFAWVKHRGELRSQLVTLIGRLPETTVPLQTTVKLVSLTKGTESEPITVQLLQRWTTSGNTRLATAAQQQLSRIQK